MNHNLEISVMIHRSFRSHFFVRSMLELCIYISQKVISDHRYGKLFKMDSDDLGWPKKDRCHWTFYTSNISGWNYCWHFKTFIQSISNKFWMQRHKFLNTSNKFLVWRLYEFGNHQTYLIFSYMFKTFTNHLWKNITKFY